MELTTITDLALSLPKQERIDLARALYDSVREDAPTPLQKRANELLEAAATAVGVDVVPPASQRAEYVLARAFVAFALRREGHTLDRIGQVLKKDHATVCHLIYKMEWMLGYPQSYKEELDKYRRFKSLAQLC